MSVVPEPQRVVALRGLGVSEQLVSLSSGHVLHELFRSRCLGPPYFVYHSGSIPVGPPFIPLWDRNDMVVGVWERPDGPEFIEFSVEASEEPQPLARTEQGFWTTQFDYLYECELSFQQLREAAAAVAFRYLGQNFSAREAADTLLVSFSAHQAWLRELVAEIDRHSATSPP